MNLSNYTQMDPHLLVGLVNTGLRNDAHDLDDFVKTHGLDREKLIHRLEESGYQYVEDAGQFRAAPQP